MHVSIALRKLGNLFLHDSSPSRVYIYHRFNNDLLKCYLIPLGWLEGGGDEGSISLLMAPIEEQFRGTKWGKRGIEKSIAKRIPASLIGLILKKGLSNAITKCKLLEKKSLGKILSPPPQKRPWFLFTNLGLFLVELLSKVFSGSRSRPIREFVRFSEPEFGDGTAEHSPGT